MKFEIKKGAETSPLLLFNYEQTKDYLIGMLVQTGLIHLHSHF